MQAERTLHLPVEADGTAKVRVPLYAGVAGEHNVTTLVMEGATGEFYDGSSLVRILFGGADGSVVSTDLLNVQTDANGWRVSYTLPHIMTVLGGQITARLVLSLIEDGKETQTAMSGAFVLYFDDGTDMEYGTPFWTCVSQMLKGTADASERARRYAAEAVSSATGATISANQAKNDASVAAQSAKSAVEAADRVLSAPTLRYKGEAKTADIFVLSQSAAVGDLYWNIDQEAYCLWNGKEWKRLSLSGGEQGKDGKSAYQSWLDLGNVGDETSFIASLKGLKGDTGAAGPQGPKGDAYVLTDADKTDIVQELVASLGVPVFGTIGDDKTITLSGELPEGVYTIRYLTADGYEDVGTITVGNTTPEEPDEPTAPSYVNLVPTALTHTDLTAVFNGAGYMDNARASSAAPNYSSKSGYVTTGVIPVTFDTVLYIKGVTIVSGDSDVRFGFARRMDDNSAQCYACTNDAATNGIHCTLETLGDQYYKVTFNTAYLEANCPLLEYFFFSAIGTGDNLIVATTPII